MEGLPSCLVPQKAVEAARMGDKSHMSGIREGIPETSMQRMCACTRVHVHACD